MSKYYGTTGVVLAHTEAGEADSRVTVFTKDLGRVDVFAKSVRAPQSKLRGHLSLFANVRLMLIGGRGEWRLLDAEAEPIFHESPVQYKADVARFLSTITPYGAADEALWGALRESGMPTTFERLASLKVAALKALGVFPESRELKNFFSERAVAYLSGDTSYPLFKDRHEIALFQKGIKKLLEAGHVV